MAGEAASLRKGFPVRPRLGIGMASPHHQGKLGSPLAVDFLRIWQQMPFLRFSVRREGQHDEGLFLSARQGFPNRCPRLQREFWGNVGNAVQPAAPVLPCKVGVPVLLELLPPTVVS